jgi:hypothetical protein
MPIWRLPPQPLQIAVHTPILIVGGETYELSCTDGFKLGEVVATQCILGVVCTDGLKGGDSSTGAGIFPKSISDGLKVGDSCGAGFIFQLLASDGVRLSDTLRRLVGSADVSVDSSVLTNTFHLSKFTAQATGIARQVPIKSGSAIDVKLAIYADNAGEPGALLNALNAPQSLVAGWNTVLFPATSIVKDVDYWFAFNSG